MLLLFLSLDVVDAENDIVVFVIIMISTSYITSYYADNVGQIFYFQPVNLTIKIIIMITYIVFLRVFISKNNGILMIII